MLTYSPLAPEQRPWEALTSRKGLVWTSGDWALGCGVDVLGDQGVDTGYLLPIGSPGAWAPWGRRKGAFNSLREPHLFSLLLPDCEYEVWGWGAARRAEGLEGGSCQGGNGGSKG